MQVFGDCTLVVILNIAMIMDMLTGKIRNHLILMGLIMGFIYQIRFRGVAGGFTFAGGMLLSFVLTFPLFALGAVGAGDVKLLAVTGGFLGPAAMWKCLFLTLVFGAGMAFLKMLIQGSFYRRFAYLEDYVEQSIRERCLRPYGQPLNEESAVIHLSAPVLFAALVCMIGGIV